MTVDRPIADETPLVISAPVTLDSPELRSSDPETPPAEDDHGVPLGLVALVVVLLLAVAVTAAYTLRTALSSDRPGSAVDLEIDRWEQQAASTPDDPETRVSLGYAYHKGGRYAEAIEQYDIGLAAVPDHGAALYQKGVALLELDRGPEAEAVLRTLLAADPAHALGAKALARYLAGQERFEAIPDVLEPVLEQSASLADLQYQLAYAYERLGRTDLAKERYRVALTYDPGMQDALDGLKRLGVSP